MGVLLQPPAVCWLDFYWDILFFQPSFSWGQGLGILFKDSILLTILVVRPTILFCSGSCCSTCFFCGGWMFVQPSDATLLYPETPDWFLVHFFSCFISTYTLAFFNLVFVQALLHLDAFIGFPTITSVSGCCPPLGWVAFGCPKYPSVIIFMCHSMDNKENSIFVLTYFSWSPLRNTGLALYSVGLMNCLLTKLRHASWRQSYIPARLTFFKPNLLKAAI